jgi:hypothetical protein
MCFTLCVRFPPSADVVTIEKSGDQFRLLYDTKGRFVLHPVGNDEAKVRTAAPSRVHAPASPRVRVLWHGMCGVPCAGRTKDARCRCCKHPQQARARSRLLCMAKPCAARVV